MNHWLLTPPIAILVYLALVGILAWIARLLVGRVKTSPGERTTYASGEAPSEYTAVPGYRQFFVVALFFGILHLGVLVLGSEGQTLTAVIYLAGLFLALVALVLG
jgi:NADH:ubiquinone oxidoreductase subunit 3 (subunit A)